MNVPRKHSLRIVLIQVEGLELVRIRGQEKIDLNAIAQRLNRLQKLFSYEVIGPTIRLGEYTSTHGYLDETYHRTMEARIQNSRFKWAIAITPEELEEGSFNRHSGNKGLGIITTESYQNYIPPGSTLHQYLAYLILCESFCIVGGVDLEHQEKRYCLFDRCHKKMDLIECLRQPHIHEDCREKLLTLGYDVADLEQAENILKFVKAPNRWHRLGQFIQEPFQGLILGLAIGILTNLITKLDTTLVLVITIGLFAFSFISFVIYLQDR